DVGAIEHERIRAGLALDRVAAIARIPGERVVAVAEQGRIVAAAAGHNVVAVAAEQDVVALTSDDGVIAGAAVERDRRIADGQRRRGERIVAGAPRDDQRVGRLRAGDGDYLRQAGDRQRAALALHRDDVIVFGGVDGDAVRRAVAHAAAGRRCQVDGD